MTDIEVMADLDRAVRFDQLLRLEAQYADLAKIGVVIGQEDYLGCREALDQAWRDYMGTIPFPLEVFKEVHEEVNRSADRPFPKDPLRRAALVAEEAGECLKEALDLTRGSDQEIAGTDREMSGEPGRRNQGLLYVEALHTAAVAVRLMMEMKKEGLAP